MPLPGATATLVTGKKPALSLVLTNGGGPAVIYAVTANDFVTKSQTVTVRGRKSATLSWPVDEWGYYDVVVTANTGNGFCFRFAGRVEERATGLKGPGATSRVAERHRGRGAMPPSRHR